MASVNPHTRELVFKLVFYGPGLGGKTTTLRYIHAATKAEHRGKMVSLATPSDRTLYFDFLPLRMPRVRGMAMRMQLFTVPGQALYAATRKLVLSGADGVVFVADSQRGRMDQNLEALEDLNANLAEQERSLEDVPHTFHWNKRDLGDLASVEELDRRLNVRAAPALPTVATHGEGVFEGLERITRLMLRAFEADPKNAAGASLAPGSDGATSPRSLPEQDIAQALREMEEPRMVEVPTKLSAVVPDIGTAEGRAAGTGIPASPAAPRVAMEAPAAPPAHRAPVASRQAAEGGADAREAALAALGFSLAEMWPESDRESVRQAEAMMAARDAVNAVLASDALVTRVLASAARLVGTLDAPRDPAVVALLLGLDGTRYLNFRTAVRAARHREPVTMRDAFEGFSFALEARRARDLLRR